MSKYPTVHVAIRLRILKVVGLVNDRESDRWAWANIIERGGRPTLKELFPLGEKSNNLKNQEPRPTSIIRRFVIATLSSSYETK